VELLVVMALMTVVLSIAGGAIVQSMRVQQQQAGRVHALNEAKIALERASQDLRAANPLQEASPTRVVMRVDRNGVTRTHTYEVVEGTRLVLRRDGSTAVLTNDLVPGRPVFSFFGDGGALLTGADLVPAAVRVVRVSIPIELPRGGESELENDVTLRNWRSQ
jgi:type II secretory pathway pseudopilin PulG